MTKKSQSDMGYLLQSLTAHVRAILPCQYHKLLDSWMDAAELQLSTKDQGQGLTLGMMEYDAELSLERFPFCEFDPAILLAAVMAWLQTHDSFREDYGLDDPVFKVEPVSDRLANIEIDLSFIEPVSIVPDEHGLIEYQGSKYTVANYEIWTAKYFSLSVQRDQH